MGNGGGSRVGSHEGEQGSWTPKPALHPALYVVLHKTRRLPTDTCGSRQKEGSGSDSPEKSMNLCLSETVVAGSLLSTQKEMDLSFRRKNLI